MERLLQRDRTIVAIALTVLAMLAWAYILGGAGLGMSPWAMTRVSLFPHLTDATGVAKDAMGMDMGPAPAREWSIAHWATMITMWFVMMVAMMTPSVAPAVLLYSRVYRQSGDDQRLAPASVFAAGYLVIWLAFAMAAAVAHWALEQTGLVSASTMGSQNKYLSGGILIAAGLYQLTPLKNICLALASSRPISSRSIGGPAIWAPCGSACATESIASPVATFSWRCCLSAA